MDTDGISIQDRDLALLAGLFECRVMTSRHISTLYFDGSGEAAKKRLQKLKAARLIGERTRRVNEASILFLTRSAVHLLNRHGKLTAYPPRDISTWDKRVPVSELTLRHELEVMDVKTSFHDAIVKHAGLSIAEFSTWPALYQFFSSPPARKGERVLVKPDGLVRIHEKEADGTAEHTFFLEVDRSTESQETLAARATCYTEYYQSGQFAVWNGASASEFKEYPFRVLIVLKNAERRNNTAERLLTQHPPIFTQVLLSTFAEVLNDPLGRIWIQPLDYRDITRGTEFDPDRRRAALSYRRQTEREALVEQRVQKRNLLEA